MNWSSPASCTKERYSCELEFTSVMHQGAILLGAGVHQRHAPRSDTLGSWSSPASYTKERYSCELEFTSVMHQGATLCELEFTSVMHQGAILLGAGVHQRHAPRSNTLVSWSSPASCTKERYSCELEFTSVMHQGATLLGTGVHQRHAPRSDTL